MTDMNILDLFLKASLLVKLIMLILIGFSIAAWAIIIQRTRILNAAGREAEAFEDKFWSGIELSRLYQESQGRRENLTGSEQIFYSGFKEFARLHRANNHAPEAVVEGASRAMRISMNRELENLDRIPGAEGGDLYLINGNMLPLKNAGAFANTTDNDGKEEKPDEEVLEVEEPGTDGNDAGGEDTVSERNNRRRKLV